MDAIAATAEVSERSVYAHFSTKDRLFLAVIGRSKELFGGRMLTPDHYGGDPAEAVTRYSGRFLQMLAWRPIVQTLRLGISEADRLPEAAAQIHEAFYGAVARRLATYLTGRYALSPGDAARLADRLLGAVVHPRLLRLLLGADPTRRDMPDEGTLDTEVDLPSIRSAIETLLPRP